MSDLRVKGWPVLAAILLMAAVQVYAGSNRGIAKIAVHVEDHDHHRSCYGHWGDPVTMTIEAAEDAYVSGLTPDAIHGGELRIRVGYDAVDGGILRGCLKFDLSSITGTVTIDAGVLKLSTTPDAIDTPPVVGAHYLGDDTWAEGTITWNNAPTSYNAAATDTTTVGLTGNWFSWDITGDVSTAVGGDDVLSVVLLSCSESIVAHCRFHSKDAPTSKPKIEITYREWVSGPLVPIDYCGDIVFHLDNPDVDAFPVFFDLVEYQGMDYSMAWPGLYSCAFTSCSDVTTGSIVFPCDGISHVWAVCQPGPIAIPGWAWIYDYGLVCVIPHPWSGNIAITDCQGEMDEPICNFCAGIGGYTGDDPCEPTRAEPASWGSIKRMFK